MTPWQQLDGAVSVEDVRAVGGRVLEVAFVDRPFFLRRMREANVRLQRAFESGGKKRDWPCPICTGPVKPFGQKNGRELGSCDRCLMGTSREVRTET